MAAYLQRIAGYCLTGRTDEQAFFFLHGSGANGKTVFLEVLADVLGSYARTAPLDTFMATRADRQPNDLAGLDGARMVIATETEAGRPWAEARIKAVTGGDRIAVRRLYGEFFETTPGYKLLIAGNHRPAAHRRRQAGMARRLHLIPFDTVIPERRAGRTAPGEARSSSATASSAGCWRAAAPGRTTACGRRRRSATPSPATSTPRTSCRPMDRRGLRGRRDLHGDAAPNSMAAGGGGRSRSASTRATRAISASGCVLSATSRSAPARRAAGRG